MSIIDCRVTGVADLERFRYSQQVAGLKLEITGYSLD